MTFFDVEGSDPKLDVAIDLTSDGSAGWAFEVDGTEAVPIEPRSLSANGERIELTRTIGSAAVGVNGTLWFADTTGGMLVQGARRMGRQSGPRVGRRVWQCVGWATKSCWSIRRRGRSPMSTAMVPATR